MMQANQGLLNQVNENEDWAQGLILGDEWANALTHGLGLCLSVIGLIFLILLPLETGDYEKLASFLVYGFSLVTLYLASTLYHSFRCPNLKRLFQKIDHCAIYLLIAGSYTPFTMMPLKGFWGWLLFGLIWGLACLGIILKTLFIQRFKRFSTALYLAMGWLVVIAAKPLIENVSAEGLYWTFAGGLFYSVGVIFYALDRIRFFHAIWHLFVLGGSTCHYFTILLHL